MAPSTRSFRPTRRDLFVASISAALSLLWFQSSGHIDSFASVRENDPWPVQAPLDAKPDISLLDGPRIIIDHPAVSPARPPQKIKPRELMPSTTMVAHGDGWTLFDNLYMFNGTLLVVSDEEESSFPEKRMITSTGKHNYSQIK